MNRNRDADEVLDVLRCGHGVVGAADLAEVLGLSLSGVRFHLGHLISTGRVRSESAPAVGRGRPRLLYRAIPAAAVEDGAAYQLLAELLAEQLFRDGRTVEQAGARWAELLLAERRPIDGVREDPIEYVSELLRDSGFDPERAGRKIRLRRCPFVRMVDSHAEVVCGLHASLICAVLKHVGAPAEVTLTAVRRSRRCQVSIDTKRPAAARLVVH